MRQLYAPFLFSLFVLIGLQVSAQDLLPGLEYGHSFVYDSDGFITIVDPAPNEGDSNPVFLQLPSPIGDSIDLVVWRSNLLDDDLQTQFPEVKTYIVGDATTMEVIGRMVVSPRGVDLVLRTANGLIMIEPDEPEGEMHTSYFSIFAPLNIEPDSMLIPEGYVPPIYNARTNLSLGEELLTYELAVIADGEYSQQRGGSNPTNTSVFAAIAADVSALNVIYERDLSIRFMLSETQIYLNPASDIFPNAASAPAAEAVIAFGDVIDAGVFGLNDFDFGHVFSGRSGGSSAYVEAVCRDFPIDVTGDNAADGPLKGGGGSRSNGLQGASWLGLVAHEMGHQFGARHTFNGEEGNCSGGNYNAGTAYEIGSGSTIMSYGGICGVNNLSGGKDLYFHINSIEAIYNYTRFGNGNCATVTNTGNTPPTADANPSGESYTIPRGTPFVLMGNGTDVNSNQDLTYTWEQYDLGTQGDPADAATDTGEAGENGAPLFRSFQPNSSPDRVFPNLNEVLGNSDRIGEVLPLVGREMNFRLVVRDNNTGGGGVTCDETTIQVDGTSGPFEIIDPDSSPVWSTGATEDIVWSVANTDNGIVNCQNVKISLSTDDGQSFPIVLTESTENDGFYSFTVPAISSNLGRIKIEAADNIFFDISNENIIFSSSCLAEAGNLTGELSTMAPAGEPALDINLAPDYGSSVNGFSATINSADPSVNLHVESNGSCRSFSNNPRYETRTFQVDQTGTYTFNLNRSNGFNGIATVHQAGFDVGDPCATFIASSGVLINGGNTVNLGNNVLATLQAGQTYVLLFSGFSSGDAGTISANIVGPSGSTVFTGTAPPGSSFAYRYIITDQNDEILAIQSNPDLTNDALFTPGFYQVYGLSVANSDVGDLSGFVNRDLNILLSSILSGSICADLSGNFAEVIVTNAPLPIMLVYFTAVNEVKSVRLKWQTSQEIDNDYFVLERSTDGRTFTPLAQVVAVGNSNVPVDYEYVDEQPLNGESFYRLIQVDLDGTTSNEGIVSVNRKLPEDMIKVYPNPIVDNYVNIQWGPDAAVTEIQLLDAAGRLIIRTDQFAETQGQERWQLPDLQAGIYFVRLFFNDGEQQSVRLVKG